MCGGHLLSGLAHTDAAPHQKTTGATTLTTALQIVVVFLPSDLQVKQTALISTLTLTQCLDSTVLKLLPYMPDKVNVVDLVWLDDTF